MTPNADRLRTIRTLVRKLPKLPSKLEYTESRDEKPAGWAPRMVSMATLSATTDRKHGVVACPAGLTLAAFPEAAQAAREAERRRTGALKTESVCGLDVAGIVLGLDPETRDELFCCTSTKWSCELRNVPKRAVIGAIDRILDGARGSEIWDQKDRSR